MKKTKSSKKPGAFRILALIFACVSLIAGLLPTLSNLYYKLFKLSEAEKIFYEYVESLGGQRDVSESKNIKDPTVNLSPELRDLYWQMVEYNEKLYEEGQKDITDPFTVQQPSFDLKQFGFADNVIGFIEIPVLKLKLPLYLGASTENMAKGAVHMSQTSLPIGGENTNCVIAAHRGTIGCGVMFKYINKIEVGDYVYITNFCEKLTYRVCEIEIISPYDIDKIMIQDGRDMVTLFSCNPLGQHIERYVVYAERVENQEEATN